MPNPSGTLHENPIIVDVDNDNHAEIVLAANNYRFQGGTGVRVFESPQDDWVATRNIWNQHAYHIDNVNDDGSIPAVPVKSWLTHNTFRLNTFPDRHPLSQPDLSVSALKVIERENGAGQSLNLLARYGNGGGAPSLGDETVSFYNGDPALGGLLLGALKLPAIAAGKFVDLHLDHVSGVTNGDEIFAVIDSENNLAECREDNNRMRLTATGTLGWLQLSLDNMILPPNSDLGITSTVSNPGNLAAGYRLETRIEDPAGSLVFSLPPQTVDLLSAGSSTNVRQTWNTGLTLAGSYRMVSVLRDVLGNVLDQDSVAFVISETQGGQSIAGLRTTTDRQQYHTTDRVQIHDLLQNLSTNTLIDAASLQLTVTDPAASVVFITTLDIGSLAPGNLRELQTPMALNAAMQGNYRIVAELRNGDGLLLATDEALFEVVENLALSLNGNVEAQLSELFIGETQVCDYTVSNTGTLNLQAQELWQVLVSVAGETEVDAQAAIRSLPAGGQTTLLQSLSMQGLTEGDYACVLQATVDGERLSLAHDVFNLKRPPINLNVGFPLGDRGRLLVLLDDNKQHCHDKDHDRDDDKGHNDRDHGKRYWEKDDKHRGLKRDYDDWNDAHERDKHGAYKHGDHCRHDDDKHGYGNREYPELDQQRAWLEQTLNEAGWSYTIVTDKYAFSRELRSGGYTTYALLSENVRLDNTTLEELREAVFRGEGLLVAGAHDERNSKINPALGIKLVGKTQAVGIEVLDTEFHAVASSDFRKAQHVLKARLEGAEIFARFTGIEPGGHDYDRDDDKKGRHDDHDRKHGKSHKDHDSDHDGKDRHDDRWKHHGKDKDDDKDGKQDQSFKSDIAITGHAYGEGRAVYMGFDLLREAATAGSNELFKKLLLHALDTVHADIITPTFGDVLPLKLTVENLGIDTPGRALITLPAGSEVVDSSAATVIGEDQLAWPFSLASGETASLTVYVVPPYKDLTPPTFEALIQTGQSPDFVDYDTVDLMITPVAAVDINIVLSDINALQQPDHAIRQAEDRLHDAQRHLERNRFEQAIDTLLQATDKLMRSEHPQARDIRLQIDALIRAVARQANEASSDRHNGRHHGGHDHDQVQHSK